MKSKVVVAILDPENKKKRPAIPLDWQTITVHNTANEDSTALEERAWLDNPKNLANTSWHYCIYENTIIQAIPDTETAWHAGDGRKGPGNLTSLSIEICEGGDYALTLATAKKFIAEKLVEKNKPVGAVVPHFHWSKKNCPRLILPVWGTFIHDIQTQIERLTLQTDWSELTALKFLYDNNLIYDYERWVRVIQANENLPAWVTFELIAKLFKRMGANNV